MGFNVDQRGERVWGRGAQLPRLPARAGVGVGRGGPPYTPLLGVGEWSGGQEGMTFAAPCGEGESRRVG